jgi:OOP family OmpA-OmpF porin
MHIIKLVSATIALGLPVAIHAQEAIPTPLAGADPAIEFPNPKHATRPRGAFVRPRNVALVTEGMTKGQIYTLLDVPHFSEGLFAVKRWNYILNFYTGSGAEYRSCQFQIRFDGKMRVAGRWWRDQECADLFASLLKEQAPVIVQAPAPTPQPLPPVVERERERATKSYEFTFDFNSVVINADGQSVLRSVASDLADRRYGRVVVAGFTDTVGSTDYNDALAARRAAAASSALRQMLPSDSRVSGEDIYARGGRDLEVDTGDEVRETRNRRVRIELFER